MKYVIMAGGRAIRWKDYHNTTKHLIKIGNESMLERLVRQLTENKIKLEEISITSNNPLYEIKGVKRNELIYDNKMYNMFYYDYLNTEITFLYGDTFYSDEAISNIINTKTNDNLFFSNGDSIIGVKVINYDKFKKYVTKMKNYKDGRAGWALYRKINNLANGENIPCSNLVILKDNAYNINSPQDYENLVKNYKGGN